MLALLTVVRLFALLLQYVSWACHPSETSQMLLSSVAMVVMPNAYSRCGVVVE